MGEQALAGMGAIVAADGVGFRVWAPHADGVALTGDFNDWATDADPLDVRRTPLPDRCCTERPAP